MLKALRGEASKNTAIAIYKIGSRGPQELIAKIGQAHLWSDEGQFAFKTKALRAEFSLAPSAGVWRLMRCITRIAALLHDIGKANVQFQAKIRASTPQGERIRHELLSALMFEEWVSKTPPVPSGWVLRAAGPGAATMASMVGSDQEAEIDTKWRARLSASSPDLVECAQYAQSILERLGKQSTPEDLCSNAIAWLVLTHHRPLSPQKADGAALPWSGLVPLGHIAVGLPQLNESLPMSKDNLKLAPELLPWNDRAWLLAVGGNADRLSKILKEPDVVKALAEMSLGGESGAKARSLFMLNLAAMMRPVLILSDYVASSQKEAAFLVGADGAALDHAHGAFANSLKVGPLTALADALPVHLLKARRLVDPFFCVADGKTARLPYFEASGSSSLATRAPEPSRFAWQDRAGDALTSVGRAQERLVFSVVVAETGAGKTLGAMKIMSAASGGQLRYTCALGLRSLTLQTGAAYRDQLGIGAQDCATMIGDSMYARMSKAGSDGGKERNAEAAGSESLDDYDDMDFDSDVEGGSDEDGSAMGRLLRVDSRHAKDVFKPKTRRMIQTPLVVCTVDHLMRASELQTGKDAQPLMRLMTADLVLDEIDNYSVEDLKALCRLVQIAGLYRRRVLLMSATVGSAAICALHEAWRHGVEASEMRLGPIAADLQPLLLMVHNRMEPEARDWGSSPEVGNAMIDAYVARAAQLPSPGRANHAVAVPSGGEMPERFESIFQTALAMSREHRCVLPGGAELSLGVVRFNKVQQARQFARWLHSRAEPAGVSLRIQCYHSRFPMYFLSEMEQGLNRLLKRLPDSLAESARLSNDPLIKKWSAALGLGAALAPKRMLGLVSATSIQETGRDHDYDFAIVEPRSGRSLVQMSGRVRRHRPALENLGPNIGVMESEFCELKTSSASKVGLELATMAAPPMNLEQKKMGIKERSFAPMLNGSTVPGKIGAWDPMLGAIKEHGGTPKSLLFGMSKEAVTLEPKSRQAWFPVDFYQRNKGIRAGFCLHANVGNASPLTSLEHLAQRFHLGAKNSGMAVGVESFPATMMFSASVNPGGSASPYGVANEWLWGRHAWLVRFRRQEGVSKLLAYWPGSTFDEKKNHVGILELCKTATGLAPIASPVVTEIGCGPFTSVENPERTMIVDHVAALVLGSASQLGSVRLAAFQVDARKALAKRGIRPPKDGDGPSMMPMSFSVQNYRANEDAALFFDVLLGADSATSQWDLPE